MVAAPAAGRLVVVLVMIRNHGKKQKSANEAAILRTTHIYIYIQVSCLLLVYCIPMPIMHAILYIYITSIVLH